MGRDWIIYTEEDMMREKRKRRSVLAQREKMSARIVKLERTLKEVRDIASEMAYFGEGTPSLVERLRALVLPETTIPTPAPEEDDGE